MQFHVVADNSREQRADQVSFSIEGEAADRRKVSSRAGYAGGMPAIIAVQGGVGA